MANRKSKSLPETSTQTVQSRADVQDPMSAPILEPNADELFESCGSVGIIAPISPPPIAIDYEKLTLDELKQAIERITWGARIDTPFWGVGGRLWIPLRDVGVDEEFRRALRTHRFTVFKGTQKIGKLNRKDQVGFIVCLPPSKTATPTEHHGLGHQDPFNAALWDSGVIDDSQASDRPSAHLQSTPIRRSQNARRKSTSREAMRDGVMFAAIAEGLRGIRYCRFLHSKGISPQPNWVSDGCPKTYHEAYENGQPWQKKIQDEKHRAARKMRRLQEENPEQLELLLSKGKRATR